MSKSHLVVPGFYSRAKSLRNFFESIYADSRGTPAERFVWDYWHVPEQYTHLRTPAWTYFPQALYRPFHTALVKWGRKHLGCHDISPPWMSSYIEGCYQNLHTDVPHGPWAWVYSLTPPKTQFRGGRTLLLKPSILDYWSSGSHLGLEQQEIFEGIFPRWNQLTLFDARVPHGVEKVTGTHDPLHSRLVIHGWFVPPRPYIEGPLPTRSLANLIESLGPTLEKHAHLGMEGYLNWRLHVLPSGRVSKVHLLFNTLRGSRSDSFQRPLIHALKKHFATYRFPKARSTSEMTLPIAFEGKESS